MSSLFGEMSPTWNVSKDRLKRMNVDIVFVIDATESMQPLIDTVKNLTLKFHEVLTEACKEAKKPIQNLRTKVIVFRDYYIDDKDAMLESKFFLLPEETGAFYDFIGNIHEGGGGDEPESGLEALALAIRPRDFVAEGEKRRHVIVLFSDASAHPLEQQLDGVPSNYPPHMPKNLQELQQAWGDVEYPLAAERIRAIGGVMDPITKRLVLFTPDVKPWTDISSFSEVTLIPIDRGNGGSDVNAESILDAIIHSVEV